MTDKISPRQKLVLLLQRRQCFGWKRIASSMAKTKAMCIMYLCIINRSTKLASIQHEKKHGKGSKNSSAYFDSRIDIEQETDNLIADYSFDECSFFKDDDDMCA